MTENKEQENKTIRPWGYFVNVADGSDYLVKVIHVNPHGKLSVQSHNHRSEHWFITKGLAKVLINKTEYSLTKGDSINIPVKTIHSVFNPSENELELVEIQTGDYLSEDDIIRYEDIYGRV